MNSENTTENGNANAAPGDATQTSQPGLAAGRSRTGKIARLPLAIRQELNQRLQNGEPGKELVAWLNGRPEVQAVLAARFKGQPIVEPNLSAWKQGGYHDWQEEQKAVGAVARLFERSTFLQAAAKGGLIDRMTLLLAAKMALELHRLNSLPDGAEKSSLWRELTGSLVRLRRGDLEGEWLRLAQEKLALRRREISSQTKAGEQAFPSNFHPVSSEPIKPD